MLPKSINPILLQLTSAVNQPDPGAVLPAEGSQAATVSAVRRPKRGGWFHPTSRLTPSATAPLSSRLLRNSISCHSPVTDRKENDVHLTFSCYFSPPNLGFLGDRFMKPAFDRDEGWLASNKWGIGVIYLKMALVSLSTNPGWFARSWRKNTTDTDWAVARYPGQSHFLWLLEWVPSHSCLPTADIQRSKRAWILACCWNISIKSL